MGLLSQLVHAVFLFVYTDGGGYRESLGRPTIPQGTAEIPLRLWGEGRGKSSKEQLSLHKGSLERILTRVARAEGQEGPGPGSAEAMCQGETALLAAHFSPPG